MQQILETQISRATFFFLSGNLAPLSTSSALICSTESRSPPPACRRSPARGLSVYHRIGTVFIHGAVFFLFLFSAERAERLLVRFITPECSGTCSRSFSQQQQSVYRPPHFLTRGCRAGGGRGESRRGCQKNTLTRAPAANQILRRRT